ncbi:MAG: hypothetical protein U0804_21280 [Gemmataceae bacterium]
MAQLTLRTLLAYLDDTLEPTAARELGKKVAESDVARELVERIKKITRRRRLQTPDIAGDDEDISDPNTVAEYLSNTLDADQVQRLEQACLDSDVYLAEVAACHQILTVVLAEPVRVPPSARERMYKLVPPPAGSRKARTRPNLPVIGGSAAAEKPDAEDADAALLLGMTRFGAGSSGRRAGMAAAGAGIAALLAVAVYMAIPGRHPDVPATAPPEVASAVPAPRPAPTPKPPETEPAPKPPEPMPAPMPMPMPMPTPPDMGKVPDKKGPPAIAPPRADRLAVGKATLPNVLLVTRPAPDAKWTRLDPGTDAVVSSTDEVVSLPGYKAEVKLDTGVTVSLWGNVPDLVPARLLESRVRFHAPTAKDGGGFEHDADLTLLAGRVYLTPAKGSERVRVRAAGEVYDFTLPERSEVAVELTVAHEPGAMFLRTAGPAPRAELKVAVLRGSAALAVPARGVSYAKIDAPAQLSWDSKAAGRPTAPAPIDKTNTYFDKFPLLPSEQAKAVQKALSDVTGRLADSDRAQILMTELVTQPPMMGQYFQGVIGIYGLAAVASTADDLKTLVDVLTDETRGPQRIAAATALSAWLARSADNTAALGAVLDTKIPADGVADLVLRLLRGAVNPTSPEPVELDRLVDLLGHPSVAVRELALWNLITLADPAAARVPGLVQDVGMGSGMAHERFVRAWRARVEEIKKRPPAKK